MSSGRYITVILISFLMFGNAYLRGLVTNNECCSKRKDLGEIESPKSREWQQKFLLEKDATLDTESEALIEFGLKAIRNFDVDSFGNIYIFNNSEPSILCFNDKGSFLRCIGRAGQGPGELGQISSIHITASGHISMYDLMNRKVLVFSHEGQVKEEMKFDAKISVLDICFLKQNRYLILEKQVKPDDKSIVHSLAIYDQDFTKLSKINGDVRKVNPIEATRYDLLEYPLHFRISHNLIYVSNSQKHESVIESYDTNGQPVRRITEKFARVKISDDYKNDLIARIGPGRMWEMVKDKAYFPEYFPPLKSFYIDDDGRILVESYRTNSDKSEIEVDILTAEGKHIGIINIPVHKGAVFRNGRFYLVTVKENGYYKLEIHTLSEVY